jgi:hypothetical protein
MLPKQQCIAHSSKRQRPSIREKMLLHMLQTGCLMLHAQQQIRPLQQPMQHQHTLVLPSGKVSKLLRMLLTVQPRQRMLLLGGSKMQPGMQQPLRGVSQGFCAPLLQMQGLGLTG